MEKENLKPETKKSLKNQKEREWTLQERLVDFQVKVLEEAGIHMLDKKRQMDAAEQEKERQFLLHS